MKRGQGWVLNISIKRCLSRWEVNRIPFRSNIDNQKNLSLEFAKRNILSINILYWQSPCTNPIIKKHIQRFQRQFRFSENINTSKGTNSDRNIRFQVKFLIIFSFLHTTLSNEASAKTKTTQNWVINLVAKFLVPFHTNKTLRNNSYTPNIKKPKVIHNKFQLKK